MRLAFFASLSLIYIVVSIISLVSVKKPYIKFLDVGQGDSVLVGTPGGKLVLIDGGGNYEADSQLPSGVFFNKCEIEVMILTHPHADHSLGLERIQKRCKVHYFLDFDNVHMGKSFEVDGVVFKVLWPPDKYNPSDKNDLSVVLLLEYQGFSALLTGDAGGAVLCGLKVPNLDMYKISHHGSITGLCEKINSRLAVISVGENTFGHPSEEVLESLQKSKMRVYRTDTNGTVMILLEHGSVPSN